jgi:hypothetical protein
MLKPAVEDVKRFKLSRKSTLHAFVELDNVQKDHRLALCPLKQTPVVLW